MKLTPKVRLRIYKKALEKMETGSSSLCNAIYDILSELYPKIRSIERSIIVFEPDHLKKFPELYKRKPKIHWILSAYWFLPRDTAPRIRILKLAIRELKRKGY